MKKLLITLAIVLSATTAHAVGIIPAEKQEVEFSSIANFGSVNVIVAADHKGTSDLELFTRPLRDSEGEQIGHLPSTSTYHLTQWKGAPTQRYEVSVNYSGLQRGINAFEVCAASVKFTTLGKVATFVCQPFIIEN